MIHALRVALTILAAVLGIAGLLAMAGFLAALIVATIAGVL